MGEGYVFGGVEYEFGFQKIGDSVVEVGGGKGSALLYTEHVPKTPIDISSSPPARERGEVQRSRALSVVVTWLIPPYVIGAYYGTEDMD